MQFVIPSINDCLPFTRIFYENKLQKKPSNYLIMNPNEKVVDKISLENGFEIDLDEGWSKLITSQFGGTPGRAFSELIQNAIDSYPGGTPWKERKGAISTNIDSISITDWGEGLDTKRLELLATAGGTDKAGDNSKLGRFGLGFISIFNPRLFTRRVVVLTRCESHVVEMIFTVKNPEKRPAITVTSLNMKIDFSTRITLQFSDSTSVNECLKSAKRSLAWYPCPMTINGEMFTSEWQAGSSENNLLFTENSCDGLLRKGSAWHNVNILCKYELVMNTTLTHFITGGHNMKHNLEDYEINKTPFIPDLNVVININNLSLVISRDNYYLDLNYRNAKKLLNLKLRNFLYLELAKVSQAQVIIANQYILGNEIYNFLNDQKNNIYDQEENRIIRLLACAPVYRINGRPGLFSLVQLKRMLRPRVPLYYSPEKTNLRWLGGSFTHDFILIPDPCNLFSGSALLYDRLFECVFKDVVNLDSIISDTKRIQNLVNRGLVDKSVLSPRCEIIGMRRLTENQKTTIEELTRLLSDPDIREIISDNLHIAVVSIRPVFFSLNDEGTWLSTGLFDSNGKPVSEEYVSNILEDSGNITGLVPADKKIDLLLGLNLDHPFINFLVDSTSRHKEYYTLTYLAHELALCQKMLVPYSPFYHLVKEKLAQEMRKALMKNLLSRLKN